MSTFKHKIVFLFSGQGSQYRGMGKELFENNTVFNTSIRESDALIKHHLNYSIIDELYVNKDVSFDDLLITNPAIVAIELAILDVFESEGIYPDYSFGTSLGELASIVTCEGFSKQTALEISIELAKVIVRNDIEGGMIAVLEKNTNQMKKIYEDYDLFLASDNFSGHFTLSGSLETLKGIEQLFQEKNITSFLLPVKAPFHSPLILQAESNFKYFMSEMNTELGDKCELISSIRNMPVKSLTSDYFWEACVGYSNFNKSISYLESMGSCLYIDLGPSGSNATFVKYNLSSESQSQTFQIMTPYKGDQIRLNTVIKLIIN